MKNKKKFGRKLNLNKETIATLEQRNVRGGKETYPETECCAPCGTTFPTEVVCSAADCYTINYTLCYTNCNTCITNCETCNC